MRRLNKNYWRLAWVFATNSAVVLLWLTGPIRVRHDQLLIYQSMRATPPPFLYLKELFATPWAPVVASILLIGILAEMRRIIVSPILNLGPYGLWLALALYKGAGSVGGTPQELFLAKVLVVFPLAVVATVDLIFYVNAFRQMQVEVTD